VTFRKYLVLAGITIFSTAGDSLLARGMKDSANISLHDLSGLLLVITNPWVALGILCLLVFFSCYTSALSWADLTYVLPATSLGYVLVAFVGHFALGESISPTRWMGIVMIAVGVGFAAAGPPVTPVRHLGVAAEHADAASLKVNSR
jgi:drug/metabolite transporter (DMT)-like permease